MKKYIVFCLVFLWALLAGFFCPADATNWYPDNQLSLTAAQTAAQPGDTIFIGGQYTYSDLTPARAGNTLQPIVFIGGDLSNPGSTAIQRIRPKSHCRFYGLAFSDTVGLHGSPSRVVFDHCSFADDFDFRSADSSSVRSSSFAGAYLRVCRDLSPGDDNSAVADTLEWNTFTGLNATNDFAMAYGNTSPANYVSGFVRRFNRFAVTQTGSTAWTIDKHWRTSNMLSYANYLQITSTASGVGSNEGNFVSLWRDSSHTLTMKRDTIFVDNASSSMSATFYGLITSSGMGGAYSTSCTNYTVDSCYIRMVRGSPMYFQAQIAGGRIRYNVLRSRMGTGLELASAFLASSNDPYFHHNTIWGPQAVYFGGYAATGGRFSNNILWGTSSATCSDWTAVGGNQDAVALSDSNLVYSATGDSSRAFSRGACASPRTGAWTSAGNDSHSYWANPAFQDTTWTNFNPAPTLAFALSSDKWTLGYVGARATSDLPVTATAFAADVKAATAGLSLWVGNDVDSTATVSGFYTVAGIQDSMPVWYRLPYSNQWATSLFGLPASTSVSLSITVARGSDTATIDTTITTLAENWWEQPIKGPMVWVGPYGSDTGGDGSYGAPYATINKGWAVLKAKPNYGKGGAIALKAGTYYQTGYLDGAEGYATPDSMYHLVGEAGATVSGADSTVVQNGLTWTALGTNGVYKAYYGGADSVGTVYVGSALAHKCTSRTEILTGAGTGGAGAWTYNDYSWWSNGTDTLWVRALGASPGLATIYIAKTASLLSLFDKYFRITGIAFTYAGGATGNGLAIKVGTGSCATCSANGAVIDSCTFAYTTRQAIYSFTGASANGDSVVVANCTFTHSASVLGYKATKGRLEETMAPLGADGSRWLVTGNTMTGWGGGPHLDSSAGWTNTRTNDWDITNNTISSIGDDALELDGGYARNFKVYSNLINGCNNGISLAPILGGPVFILHNRLRGYDYWGIQSGAFKLGTGGIGTSVGVALIANNTCFGDSLAATSYGIFDVGAFKNKYVYNNIFASHYLCYYFAADSYMSPGAWDYNLLWVWDGIIEVADIGDGNAAVPLADIQAAGYEAHGVWANPAWVDTATALRVRAGSNLGHRLQGISGKIVTLVGAPDIGASEYSPASAVASRRKSWLGVWLGLLKRAF